MREPCEEIVSPAHPYRCESLHALERFVTGLSSDMKRETRAGAGGERPLTRQSVTARDDWVVGERPGREGGWQRHTAVDLAWNGVPRAGKERGGRRAVLHGGSIVFTAIWTSTCGHWLGRFVRYYITNRLHRQAIYVVHASN
jgi:hypothetical protein